jgi:hypothetical protein
VEAGRIVYFYSYSDSNDALFTTQNAGATCQDGFWVRMTDPGAKTVVAQIMAALHSGAPVAVWAEDGQVWPGSFSGRFCRVIAVRSASG